MISCCCYGIINVSNFFMNDFRRVFDTFKQSFPALLPIDSDLAILEISSVVKGVVIGVGGYLRVTFSGESSGASIFLKWSEIIFTCSLAELVTWSSLSCTHRGFLASDYSVHTLLYSIVSNHLSCFQFDVVVSQCVPLHAFFKFFVKLFLSFFLSFL